jgi:hypothetical protein
MQVCKIAQEQRRGVAARKIEPSATSSPNQASESKQVAGSEDTAAADAAADKQAKADAAAKEAARRAAEEAEAAKEAARRAAEQNQSPTESINCLAASAEIYAQLQWLGYDSERMKPFHQLYFAVELTNAAQPRSRYEQFRDMLSVASWLLQKLGNQVDLKVRAQFSVLDCRC